MRNFPPGAGRGKRNLKPYSNRLKNLPPYLFEAINVLKREAYARKQDVIDLGMGNPDMPTPGHIVDELCETIKTHPTTHRYPQAKGMPKLRNAVAGWYEKRYGVKINPESEVLVLLGSKEGIAHMSMTYIDAGDVALVPNPTYLCHRNGVLIAGGQIHDMPLVEENGYIPDLNAVPADVAKKSKLMYISYPNNPTTAVLEDTSFFKKVVEFAKKNDIIVCHDFAYSELVFDGYRAPSFMQVPGAKDVGVEFHSFSKTYCMPGWRLGFVVGNAEILRPVEKLKSYVDFGAFTAVQLAGVKALTASQKCVDDINAEYRRRRDRFVKDLNKSGWQVNLPKATMYLWARLPEGFRHMSSLEFCELLILKTGIAIAPGSAFGSLGEGYVRMALVTHYNRFHDAVLRIKKFLVQERKG